MYVIYKTNGQVLAHHGIKGQKWGVRRYQNHDGTYTPEGRKHYGIGDSRSHGLVEKFGDRRQVEGLVRKTIPAGYTFYRLQPKNANNMANANGGVYVYGQQDKHNLRSIVPWIARTRSVSESDIEEVKMKTTRTIKVASQEDVDAIISEMVKDPKIRSQLNSLSKYAVVNKIKTPIEELSNMNEQQFTNEVEKAFKDAVQELPVLERLFGREGKRRKNKLLNADKIAKSMFENIASANEVLDNIGNKKIDDLGLQEDVDWMESYITDSIAGNTTIQKYVYDNIRKAGFNAIYDNNMIAAGLNTRVQEAHEPLILLDDTLLNKVGSTDKIDVNYSSNQFDKYSKKVRDDSVLKAQKKNSE